MFWNKKEMRKLPDLPPIQSPFAQNFPSERENNDDFHVEKHSLPSFPDSPMKKGFSQAAIKEAITDNEEGEKFESIGEPLNTDQRFGTVEMNDEIHEKKPIIQQRHRERAPHREAPLLPPPKKEEVHELTEEYEKQVIEIARPQKKEKNEIFVKIEKFQSARKSLEMIEKQIEEIDQLLKKIRETKIREEQELSSWENEITSVKARIDEVTKSIFEKA